MRRDNIMSLKKVIAFLMLSCILLLNLTSKKVILADEKALSPIFINEIEISSLTSTKVREMIEDQMKQNSERKLMVHIGDRDFEIELVAFAPRLAKEVEQLEEEILSLGLDLDSMAQVLQLNESQYYELTLDYIYDQSLVEKWVKFIEKEVYVEKIEPELEVVNDTVLLKEGQEGQFILSEELESLLIQALEITTKDSIEIEIDLMNEPREKEVSQLKKVDTKIASYSTNYAIGVPRAQNVELAASKINHTILMPNEQFSYEEKVAPVDEAHGYVSSFIFFDGKSVPGIGGGVCQVSSTLYNAQLKAGIIATERRNHSLPVSYVPLCQDATMVEHSIDLKFINTLSYPIYIHAYAAYGTVTVELWSHSESLNGVTYQPKTVIYDNGLKADTTLYGYNADGEVVYEQFLHTSIYREKVN